MTTGTGQNFDFPTVDSTSLSGEWVAENSAVTEQDETFGNVQFSSYIASSKVVKVSRTLLNDSFFSLDQYLADALATRIGRLTNLAYTSGNGVSKPTGVIHDAAIAKTSASSTAVTFNELKDTWAALDAAYDNNARWMFKKATLNAISKLVDDNGQYLWQPSVQSGTPDKLLGKPIFIWEDMANYGANALPIAYGDFKRAYVLAKIGGMTMIRDNVTVPGFTNFLIAQRYGGIPLNNDSVKWLKLAAS